MPGGPFSLQSLHPHDCLGCLWGALASLLGTGSVDVEAHGAFAGGVDQAPVHERITI